MFYSDATLTFPQTIVLRYWQLEAPEKRAEQPAADYENGSMAGSGQSSRHWRIGNGFAPGGSRSRTSRLPTHYISLIALSVLAGVSDHTSALTSKGRARGQVSCARALWTHRRPPGGRVRLGERQVGAMRVARRSRQPRGTRNPVRNALGAIALSPILRAPRRHNSPGPKMLGPYANS